MRKIPVKLATTMNLATSLIVHESVCTTLAKAKRAQRYIEPLITLAKTLPHKESQRLLQTKIYRQDEVIPKLQNSLAERYKDRQGGYTRVLHMEPRLGDSAPQAVLELVGGSKDMRTALAAKAVARSRSLGFELPETTQKEVKKLIRTRENGEEEFENLVRQMQQEFFSSSEN
ncbi:hypothetical protein CANCADRAFT_33046 [Tortispora caseinolytica NRRL Y-17796]|uniref:Uncharacterized protein n=1 Tax=Tortispora caseinolytica NRRL Y-17796 TaxID=767744 RepID=A0A1E4T9M3_9ASCO|nr:hypothetical protein CANCADRAFT_33046 [Tortispora caseinolytica NRRL Y-17796]